MKSSQRKQQRPKNILQVSFLEQHFLIPKHKKALDKPRDFHGDKQRNRNTISVQRKVTEKRRSEIGRL
jgi:hypothetical protein